MPEVLTPPNPSMPSPAENGFDLHAALSFLWRRWKFIVVVLALVFLAGAIVRWNETPLYTATAEVLLDQPREKAPGEGALVDTFALDAASLEGQMALIRSTVFLRRVVEREHLAAALGSTAAGRPKSPAISFPPVLSSSFSSLLLPIENLLVDQKRRADQPASPATGSDSIPPAEMRAIAALQGALTVKRVAQEGYVISISVTSPDPVQAARLANAVANSYLADKLDARFEAAKRASEWLSDRLVGLREQLRASEEAVAAFRAKHGFIETGGATLTQQQLSKLNASLIDAKADLSRKRAQLELLQRLETKGGSITTVPGIGNTTSAEALQSLEALRRLEAQAGALSAKEADLLTNYTATNPFVASIRAQLHTQLRIVNRAIAEETKRLATIIRNDYQLAKARVASLERALQQAAGQTGRDDATAVRLREIERTAAINKILFEDFLKQAKITQAQSTFQPQQNVRIITPAVAPDVPSFPIGKVRFMAVNLLIGMLLGVGGAFIKEKLATGLTTPQELKDLLGLPLLASVSCLARRDLRIEHSMVPIHDLPIVKPLSRFGEAIRSLRSGVRMTDIEHPPIVIQVTSAAPGEGKTAIGLSLAASAAVAKLKVLFIDADLRHSTATRIFGVQKALGLSDLLSGKATIKDVVGVYRQGGYEYLYIGAGAKTHNPTDLLASEFMKEVITVFKDLCDLVIVDSPPVGPVIDAVTVSCLCDAVILVVKWDATARELIKIGVDHLFGQCKIAGVVFNRVNDRRARKYGKYASSYYHVSHNYKSYYQG